MYAFPEMIDMGLSDGGKWPSKAHQTVAINLLCCNPRITTCQQLHDFVAIINSKTEDEIKTMTLMEFVALGFPVN